MFWLAGHGKYAGYEFSFDDYNKRWARLGLTGIGVIELWGNWGSYNIYPDMFKSGYVEQDIKCNKCKLMKPRDKYRRHQGNLKKSVCIDCVRAANASEHEQCECTRKYEIWNLCTYCITRATHVSAYAHGRAVKEATKIPPSKSTRPSSAQLEYKKGSVIGVP